MSDPEDRALDPDAVVILPNGDRIRPDRFSSDGTGITITPSGELNDGVNGADALLGWLS